MQGNDLRVTDGGAAGAWIRSRLGGEFGAVTLQVPKDFEAYARVFHPAADPQGNPVSWDEVAKACGTVSHGEMQWHAILGLSNADELRGFYDPSNLSGLKWAGSDPPTGELDIEILDVLCGVLASHTADPAHCFFGLCTIESWLDSFSADELQSLLELPHGRDYIVLAGPLSAVDQIARDRSELSSMEMTSAADDEKVPLCDPKPSDREAPNLIWPQDCTWLVASEVDFDSTLVGGSAKLIEAIVKAPELEAWQVAPSTSLAADADKTNARQQGEPVNRQSGSSPMLDRRSW